MTPDMKTVFLRFCDNLVLLIWCYDILCAILYLFNILLLSESADEVTVGHQHRLPLRAALSIWCRPPSAPRPLVASIGNSQIIILF